MGDGKFAELLDEIRVHVVQLEPDDIVVIESKHRLGEVGIERIRDLLDRHLPGIRTMVLDDDLTLRAVLRRVGSKEANDE